LKETNNVIQQSKNEYFDVNSPGWNLNPAGGGQQGETRTFTPKRILFLTPFPGGTVPNIVLGLNHLDLSQDSHGTRVEVTADGTDHLGFNLHIASWDATVVSGIGVFWLAYNL
jgi:H-type lectin domain